MCSHILHVLIFHRNGNTLTCSTFGAIRTSLLAERKTILRAGNTITNMIDSLFLFGKSHSVTRYSATAQRLNLLAFMIHIDPSASPGFLLLWNIVNSFTHFTFKGMKSSLKWKYWCTDCEGRKKVLGFIISIPFVKPDISCTGWLWMLWNLCTSLSEPTHNL